ncbi:hypothetical protein CGMCC3_g13595 [Colletotrichum fructicola]|nr:uncharacterized protein CGMCC3_g13595 [Colletotrichum fructicola]KAE9570265.1 hypothetical protein CGMCC3_g13595 [Colletotrichum fructicola]
MMKMGPEGLRRSRDESQDFQVQYACMVRYVITIVPWLDHCFHCRMSVLIE